jgi:hypothetical protein
MSVPSRVTHPDDGVWKRWRSWRMVDLPDPDPPTKATAQPAGIEKEMPFKMGVSGREGYAKVTLSRARAPAGGVGGMSPVRVCGGILMKREK